MHLIHSRFCGATLLLTALFASTRSAWAQQNAPPNGGRAIVGGAREVTIDLATARPVDTLKIAPGVVQFVFSHLLPKAQYDIQLSAGDSWTLGALDPSVLSGTVPSDRVAAATTTPAQQACVVVNTAFTALDAVTDEAKVSDASTAAVAAVATETGTGPGSDTTCAAQAMAIQSLVARTNRVDERTWSFGFSSAQVASVIAQVRRLDASRAVTKSWNIIITEQTTTAPSWYVTFGYAVAFMGGFDHQTTYESKGVTGGSSAQYAIVQSQNQEVYRPTPMVLWHYTGSRAGDIAWEFGPTAGVGLSTSATSSGIVLLGGASVIYHRNLALTAGLTLLPGTHLGVQKDDVYTTAPSAATINLQQYQLHPFLGLSFRFSSDPFASSTQKTPVTAPSQPNAAGTAKVPQKGDSTKNGALNAAPAPTPDTGARSAQVAGALSGTTVTVTETGVGATSTKTTKDTTGATTISIATQDSKGMTITTTLIRVSTTNPTKTKSDSTRASAPNPAPTQRGAAPSTAKPPVEVGSKPTKAAKPDKAKQKPLPDSLKPIPKP